MIMKRIIALNCSPRQGWNTDLMVKEAARGAESAGAEVELGQLYKLKNYTGCMSCFGCKSGKNLGRCIYPDDYKPLLEKIHEADGLILGTPIYLGDFSSRLRCLYERLIFQYGAYHEDWSFNYNDRKKPVLLVITCNAPLFTFDEMGYTQMIERYRTELNRSIGPTEIVIADETTQVSNYEKYDWTLFDYEERRRRRKEVFPIQLEEAYRMGAELAGR